MARRMTLGNSSRRVRPRIPSQSVKAASNPASPYGSANQTRAKLNATSYNDEEIKEHFVQKYGIEILANPPKKGFDTLVWLAPLFFGFFGIVFLYRYIFS